MDILKLVKEKEEKVISNSGTGVGTSENYGIYFKSFR